MAGRASYRGALAVVEDNGHDGGSGVKSHGGANELGVATAIGNAVKMVRQDLTRRIAEDLGRFDKVAA